MKIIENNSGVKFTNAEKIDLLEMRANAPMVANPASGSKNLGELPPDQRVPASELRACQG
jgi:hypothetical protein